MTSPGHAMCEVTPDPGRWYRRRNAHGPRWDKAVWQRLAALALGSLLGLLASPLRAEQLLGARYAEPVARYGHYALGKPHEYARVVATTDAGRDVGYDLPQDAVFEDLAPRLVRLTPNQPPALLVIVSTREAGAGLALLGLTGGRLDVLARSAPISTPNRWLNPVGAADLDGDGEQEIAAVTTPHIGGVLRVYRRRGRQLVEVDALAGFSNHVYGSAELALSAPARIAGRMQLLVPDAQRTTLRAMALDGGRLVETARCPLDGPISGPDAVRACETRLNGGQPAPGH